MRNASSKQASVEDTSQWLVCNTAVIKLCYRLQRLYCHLQCDYNLKCPLNRDKFCFEFLFGSFATDLGTILWDQRYCLNKQEAKFRTFNRLNYSDGMRILAHYVKISIN